jgi:23S rRNA (cytosine1962-C5)-methyltransferase
MIQTFLTPKQKSYELIDAGDGMKLERFGTYILARPDPEALFPRTLSDKDWQNADARFLRKGKHTEWIIKKTLPASWTIDYGGLVLQIKPTSFKHVGLFPEQLSNWLWIEKIIKNNFTPRPSLQRRGIDTPSPKVLNLFGYTGGASLACAQAGAEVTHIDGSKSVYSWAKKNQTLSNLTDAKMRFLIDDALLFLKKEIKRKAVYDAIIMDPPSFGHGPNGELWKIEEQLVELFSLAFKVLSPQPLFFLINGYSAGYSVTTYKNNLEHLVKKYGGTIEVGELQLECTSDTLKKLPAGIVARWSR